MKRLKNALRAGACVSLLLAIAGCEQFEIADRTMKINDAVQNADTRQVLVNVVRASKQYPLIFTATSQILSSGVADNSTLGFSIPFGPKNANIYSASPSIKVQEGLSVTTVPLDTQEFEQGFMQPVSISTVGYYLANGWTKQIVVHAFVQEIDLPAALVNRIKAAVSTACGLSGQAMPKPEPVPSDGAANPPAAPCTFIPDPDLYAKEYDGQPAATSKCPALADLTSPPTASDPDESKHRDYRTFVNAVDDPPCHFAAFQYFVAMLETLHLQVAKAVDTAGSGSTGTISSDDKNLKLTIAVGSAEKDTTGFAIDNVLPPECTTPPHVAGAAARAAAPPPPIAPQIMLGALAPPTPKDATAAPPVCADPGLTRFIVRAPEGVIYYLGSLLSAQTRKSGPISVYVRNPDYRDDLTLFALGMPDQSSSGAIASVEVDGDTYFIPKNTVGPKDQTMHMITLAQQIVALQKMGSSLPTVPTVQLIGQ